MSVEIVDKLFASAYAKTMLAPMAGYTDPAFRAICADFGAGLTVTEMVSSKAIEMNNQNTKSLLIRLDSGACPSFCQIFGHEPQVMANSVLLPQMQAYQGIDINMGCPVKKIVGGGDGSALLSNPKLASQGISAVKLATKGKPVSVKFRLGITDASKAVDFAKMCKDSGADFITVHFRTAKQMYSGTADYSLLPQIASVGIPVFANGDVDGKQRYEQLLSMGAYGVAIGRAAIGRPWIFSEIAGIAYQINILELIERHTKLLAENYSARVVNNEMKKHVAAYLKGVRNSRPVVVQIMNSRSSEEMLSVVRNFLEKPEEVQ